MVTVAADRTGRRVRVPVGEQLELVWQGLSGPRARTVELLEVRLGVDPTWRLTARGPARSGQRRSAVRAELALPVTLTDGDRVLVGTSLDVSETGLLGRWPVLPGGWPASSDLVTAGVQLAPEEVLAGAAQVRRVLRGPDGWLTASVVFTELSDRERDRLRRRVFDRLRELARRGVR